MAGDPATHSYSRKDIRRLCRVTERQLKSWENQGFVEALATYGFHDLIALRSLAELRRAGVSTVRIRRALAALREKLADVTDPLTELRLFSEGRNVHVQLGGRTMEAVSGQLLLGFDQEELQRLVSFPSGGGAKSVRERENRREQAESLFQQALELEQSGATLDAIELYRSILEIDPLFAGALVNLGTLYFAARDLERARDYYEEAVHADPSYALAHFNLGNLYDEMGEKPAALAEYQAALRLQPTYADAHYNIALLYQAGGEVLRAVRHWKTYLKLDPMSPWASIARRELERLYRQTVVDTREQGGGN